MKNIFLPYFLALTILVILCPEVKSQDFCTNAAGERIQVCTDRTMYVSGEKVHFSAVIFNVTNRPPDEFSRIFYCELITPEGKRIAGGKYPLQKFAGQGSIAIPEETISGIYFLKFYTRLMRNIGADEYKYIRLKIINPYKTEVLPGNDVADTTDPATTSMGLSPDSNVLKILSGKRSFSPREEIRLSIRVNTAKGPPAGLCLSVIPESTCEDHYIRCKNSPDSVKTAVFMPETRGISLSGQLLAKASGKPVPNAIVNLSIIGDKDIQVTCTGPTGKFLFALPDYDGKRDIFLCADDIPGVASEIFIENDFCSKPVNLPSPRFTLNETEMMAAYRLAVNFRVASAFRVDTIEGDIPGKEKNAAFYGKPSEILVMDKYIELPSLGEYFTQLPGILKLKKIQGRNQFRFYTTVEAMAMYGPLMLVDWVAVNDIEKILSMSPLEIERIELVNSLYVKGDIIYGGIISFVSKKNDFAGIDLPKSGTFVNYRFLGPCSENSPPLPASGNIPDARSTVYWNPAVQINDEGLSVVSFTAPDSPGKYHILLRQIGNGGEVGTTDEVIEVGEIAR